jgi:uncharacterized repeat protein (TIGR01451 family)
MHVPQTAGEERVTMRLSSRFLAVLPVLVLMLISALIVAPPVLVTGAPPPQGTPPARPTVPVSGPGSSPLASGAPIDSAISLALVVDKAEALPGDTLAYKAQITNVAGQEATNVWLTCDLPDEVAVEDVSATLGEIHNYGQRISIALGRLQPAHESQYITIQARIRDDAAPGAELVHHANLTSDQAGGGEQSVITMILGEAPEPTKAALPLPTTGSGRIPLWLAAGFVVLIVVIALFSMRERILPR